MGNVLEIVKILLGLYCVLAAWRSAVYVVRAYRVEETPIHNAIIKRKLYNHYIETAGKCSAKLVVSVVIMAVMIYVTGV